MEQHGLMKNGPTSVLREQGGEIAPEIPQNLKIPLPRSISSCSSSKDSAQRMEQLGLMKNGPTSILREQGGETRLQIAPKFRSFDRFLHVVRGSSKDSARRTQHFN